MDALFGEDLEKFTENEQVSKSCKCGKVFTFHVFAKHRVKEMLSVSHVDLLQYNSYYLEEVNHSLCSYTTITPVGHSTTTSLNCYSIEHENFKVHFIANNYDNSNLLHVYFMKPLLHKQVLIRDCDRNPKKSHTSTFLKTVHCPFVKTIKSDTSALLYCK